MSHKGDLMVYFRRDTLKRSVKVFLFAFLSGESRRILNRFCLLDFLVDLLFAGSAVKIRPKEGDVYFDVVAVVDPVTREAQKLAPLLLVGYL